MQGRITGSLFTLPFFSAYLCNALLRGIWIRATAPDLLTGGGQVQRQEDTFSARE